MPLNAQEREWLKRRKNLCERCAKKGLCRKGKRKAIDTGECPRWFPYVMSKTGRKLVVMEYLNEAAEFEARVALWLLDHDYEDVPCAHGMDIFCPRPRPPFVDKGCGKWCLLRCARLAVEQEMDNADRS